MTLTTSPSDALRTLRDQPPLVQCITNFVAMNFSANVLLAAGASPAMIHTAEESGDFAAIVGALSVNIGTLSPEWVLGMKAAITGAQKAGTPWVLDPVGHFATPYRAGVAQELVDLKPTVIRGNASEILALAGEASSGRGVDASDPVGAAESAAWSLAARTDGVIAITGAVDFVTNGQRAVRIAGGHEMMPRITATGCALTCLVAAFAAVVEDPFDATIAALALFSAAGQRAGTGAAGPGSFAPAFLDALYMAKPGDLDWIEVSEA